MARKKSSSLSSSVPIPIGNCQVVVEAKNFSSESTQNSLQTSFFKTAKIKISKGGDRKDSSTPQHSGSEERGGCSFILINPKDADDPSKSLLQEVLNVYSKELPAMNYAANTGKESMFLERSVLNGKYCSLLLKSTFCRPEEVIAAITFQIIPADTQFAEVPLSAVSSIYQNKGIGRLLYMELRKRLQSVGIRTIFCWADKESEGFWLKQDFVPIGVVNIKGRARRLPIKTDVRKALCFPGGSTLMVSHLNKGSSYLEVPVKLPIPLQTIEKSAHSACDKNHELEGVAECFELPKSVNATTFTKANSQPETVKGCQDLISLEGMNCGNISYGSRLNETGESADIDVNQCSCSAMGVKKRVWEASFTSLNSKKVKGCHLDCQQDSRNDISISDGRTDSCIHGNLAKSRDESMTYIPTVDLSANFEKISRECTDISEDFSPGKPLSTGKCFTILLMNIADDVKRSNLHKIIQDLGGIVTSDGVVSTHVVTGKVRRTLNFCTALCSGAWILSPAWLKESFRNGRFVDEKPFILKDEDFELKYRTELKDLVHRAKASPGALLKGYDICLAKHVQPPVGTLSAIVRAAGGNVVAGLNHVNKESKTIFVACEEDMDQAMQALMKGIWTFNSDWFMNCIMRQELDLEAPQFAEFL